ncbi:MAG: helix-turn-helix transcriptional regulator, partial [Xanthomonadales bacterium]|nr:helix-turn-helix transcriptional regulator [Xanthomonadales bacterium]
MDPTEHHPSASYVARVNRAIDHIMVDLSRPLRLEEVAAVAGFSTFHFHRVFKALIGETLNQFVKRQRLERALYRMTHEPRRRLTEIALDCGFASSSEFSRSFKQHYGAAPSAFDLKAFRTMRRDEFEQLA